MTDITTRNKHRKLLICIYTNKDRNEFAIRLNEDENFRAMTKLGAERMMSKMHVVIMIMLLNLLRTVKLQFLVENIRLLTPFLELFIFIRHFQK